LSKLLPIACLCLLALFASFPLAAEETKAAQVEALGECRQDASAETRLSACAQAIKVGKLKGDALAFAYLQLGLAKAEKGDLKAAIKDFSSAIKLSPKATDALYDRGAAYAQVARWQEALADLNALLKIAPKDADGLYMRAWVHSQMGDDELAIKDLDAVLTLYPEDQPALFDRGGLLIRAGRPKDAAKDFSRVLDLDPKAAAAAYNRGRALYQSGDYAKSAEDFRLAMSLLPDNPYAALRWHLSSLRLGKNAAKALETAAAKLGQDEWPGQLLMVYLGKMKGEDVLRALEGAPEGDRARLLCEANFYLGALADVQDQPKAAQNYFLAAIKTQQKSSIEFLDATLAAKR
jgi:lipoprotein NlpI